MSACSSSIILSGVPNASTYYNSAALLCLSMMFPRLLISCSARAVHVRLARRPYIDACKLCSSALGKQLTTQRGETCLTGFWISQREFERIERITSGCGCRANAAPIAENQPDRSNHPPSMGASNPSSRRRSSNTKSILRLPEQTRQGRGVEQPQLTTNMTIALREEEWDVYTLCIYY
jgi:hypothetical protein